MASAVSSRFWSALPPLASTFTRIESPTLICALKSGVSIPPSGGVPGAARRVAVGRRVSQLTTAAAARTTSAMWERVLRMSVISSCLSTAVLSRIDDVRRDQDEQVALGFLAVRDAEQ